MDKAVKMALDSFAKNREMAEEMASKKEPDITNHKHGILCFRWRACRQLEQAVNETKERIKKYEEAEKGLLNGDYTKAIDLLEELAKGFEEAPWQFAIRVAFSAPTLSNIRNSPSVINSRMNKMRDDLIILYRENL